MAETAAVQKTEPARPKESEAWRHARRLPCYLTVDLPIPGFTVGELSMLNTESVIDSHWNISQDVPIRVNGELIAWSEFEVVGAKLAVRLTELA
jgi:flagellar motor switch protein FliN